MATAKKAGEIRAGATQRFEILVQIEENVAVSCMR